MYRGAIQDNDDWAGADGGWIELTFANGKQLNMSTDRLSNDLLYRAVMHGLKQKFVDAAAISRNTETGRAASIDDKYAAVKAVFDRITAGGTWNAPREGGAGAVGGLLLRALCKMYEGKKTKEELVEYLATKTTEQKTALRKNPKVAAIIEELREASAKESDIDSEELLGELDDGDEGELEGELDGEGSD